MPRILVIEDEIDICENVVDILEMEGFDTLHAHDGGTGIDLALAHQPDLVLCDIMMPVTDGYQVLMALREHSTTTLTPFIFLTAKVDRPSMRYGMELGADDYLMKPFSVQGLVRAVNTRLEKQKTLIARYENTLEDLRGNIFNMLPHELRTPLVSILGYADLLLWDTDALPPDRIRDMARQILSSGERLHHLIENFLIYAQIELTRQDRVRQAKLRDQRCSQPHRVTHEIVHEKAQRVHREADVRLDLEEVASVQVSFDSLQKIVEELVDNAFKFSKAGSPVRVRGQVIDHAYRWEITDHGRGLTAEQIASIGAGMQFERRLYEQQGGGLGLVIAQQLVELHAGQLDIQSTPGEYTTVSVKLSLG